MLNSESTFFLSEINIKLLDDLWSYFSDLCKSPFLTNADYRELILLVSYDYLKVSRLAYVYFGVVRQEPKRGLVA